MCSSLGRCVLQLELLDPSLDMSIGAPPPRRMAAPALGPAELLEQLKPQLMETLGMDPDDEEGWAAAVDGLAEQVASQVASAGIAPAPDTWVRPSCDHNASPAPSPLAPGPENKP